MDLNLQTRAGSLVDNSLILELLEEERFDELRRYIDKMLHELPLICYAVRMYLQDRVNNREFEKAKRIMQFGELYHWNEWKSLGIDNI